MRFRYLLPLLPAFLLASCSTGVPGFDFSKTNNFPEDFSFPRRSGSLPSDFWEQVDSLPGYGPYARTAYNSWPLPFIADKYDFRISDDKQSATLRRYNSTTLGFPELYMPLFSSTDKLVYTRGSLEPTTKLARNYNLLWSTSSHEGLPDEELYFDAGGSPIFWEGGKQGGPRWHFDDYEKTLSATQEDEYSNYVWWLGPASIDRHATQQFTYGERVTDTKLFAPFYILKWTGIAIWSDYTVDTQNPNGTRDSLVGHGPFFGIVWFDYKHMDDAKADVERWTGPLWGMFGKSTKATEDSVTHRINFLFLPIPYKTVNASAADQAQSADEITETSTN